MKMKTMLAIGQVIREIEKKDSESKSVLQLEGERILALSLGTGTPKLEERYTAAKASEWGLLSWVFNNGATPIIDIFSDASADVVDFLLSTIFQARNHQRNYLRIQVNIYLFIYFLFGKKFPMFTSFSRKIVTVILSTNVVGHN